MKRDVLAKVVDAGVMRAHRWILKGVSWELPAGRLSAVIGPNGSGKSTLARLLAGQMWASRGDVLLKSNGGYEPAGVVRRLVRTVQPAAPLDFEPALTARQIVLTGFFGTLGIYHVPTPAMRRRALSLLRTIGLEAVADSPYGTMSTGEKTRTLIARAMAVRPSLLILDEPTGGLDLLARERVLATIRRLLRTSHRTAVLLITHHVEELPPETHQVLVLSAGAAIAQGDPAGVLNSDVLTRAFGVRVEVHRHHDRYYTMVHPTAWRELAVNDDGSRM